MDRRFGCLRAALFPLQARDVRECLRLILAAKDFQAENQLKVPLPFPLGFSISVPPILPGGGIGVTRCIPKKLS